MKIITSNVTNLLKHIFLIEKHKYDYLPPCCLSACTHSSRLIIFILSSVVDSWAHNADMFCFVPWQKSYLQEYRGRGAWDGWNRSQGYLFLWSQIKTVILIRRLRCSDSFVAIGLPAAQLSGSLGAAGSPVMPLQSCHFVLLLAPRSKLVHRVRGTDAQKSWSLSSHSSVLTAFQSCAAYTTEQGGAEHTIFK